MVGNTENDPVPANPRAMQSEFSEYQTSWDPEFGNIVSGVFTSVLAKHSKSFSLVDCISVVSTECEQL
jgi:hypothetical protein